jgi:branched-chain amino acid transport system permease protein
MTAYAARKLLPVSMLATVAAALFLPQWALFLATISLAKGLAVLGLLLLMRAGLVSFGQGLYFCIGAYAIGLLGRVLRTSDVLLMLLAAGLASAVAASILGLLLAKYRAIFFAMLSLAFSMVLYGLLVKSPALGSTDGFNVAAVTLGGVAVGRFGGSALFAIAAITAVAAALGTGAFVRSSAGKVAAAVRDNELRIEYLGASARAVIYLNILLAAVLAGLGGGLTALAVGHVDPEMAYWTTSGELVFVAILSGTGSVLAPFLGSLAFEALRSFAYQYSPNTWQLVVGAAMLVVISVAPSGLWSVFSMRRRTG